MKKLILFAFTSLAIITYSNAQEISKNAIGLRLGDSRGFGAEVSYQRAISENNRLEFDFGWRDGKNYDGIKLIGLYQWVWNINGGFNWYAGPGVGFAAFRHEYERYVPGQSAYYYEENRDAFAILTGTIGIEYSFDFPLLLSLDFRPELGFGEDLYDNNDLDLDVGLGVRYQF